MRNCPVSITRDDARRRAHAACLQISRSVSKMDSANSQEPRSGSWVCLSLLSAGPCPRSDRPRILLRDVYPASPWNVSTRLSVTVSWGFSLPTNRDLWKQKIPTSPIKVLRGCVPSRAFHQYFRLTAPCPSLHPICSHYTVGKCDDNHKLPSPVQVKDLRPVSAFSLRVPD